jgi:hypothetical protein
MLIQNYFIEKKFESFKFRLVINFVDFFNENTFHENLVYYSKTLEFD